MTMKKLIIPILFLLFLSSCVSQTPYFYKVDGTSETKRQFDRSIRKSIKKAWNKLNKEEKNLLKGTKIEFTYGEQNK